MAKGKSILEQETVNVKQLAHVLGLTTVRCQQLAKEGILVKVRHGEYDLIRSIQNYAQYLRDQISYFSGGEHVE